ncbi:MAG TPA: RNA methyltransferase [Steroidobacteraceae bacterium]|nr:RNA methyltransferase [Steroidobacteraceae bacterium]
MKFDDLYRLHQKKGRDALGHFLVEGEHSVLELQKAAARNPALRKSELYVTSAHERWRSPFVTHLISKPRMAQLAETKTPQGIVAVVPILAPPPAQPGERSIYLHEVQDPGNLGTILRTLAWFGGFRCLLSPGSVDPHNSKVVRASAGAIFHVPVEVDVPMQSVRERFNRIACLDMTGESVSSADFRAHDCFLFGNEARGLPRESLASLGARPFAITGSGAVESLNLASALTLSVYELSRPPS